ncbi:MAG TPA: hypothetical protein VIM29_04610 [Bacillota bacterium]
MCLKVIAHGQDYRLYFGLIEVTQELATGPVRGWSFSPDVAGSFVGTYSSLFASSNGLLSNNWADFA